MCLIILKNNMKNNIIPTDIGITENAQITYFKTTYKRYTPFITVNEPVKLTSIHTEINLKETNIESLDHISIELFLPVDLLENPQDDFIYRLIDNISLELNINEPHVYVPEQYGYFQMHLLNKKALLLKCTVSYPMRMT
jgi:hypothetical protein